MQTNLREKTMQVKNRKNLIGSMLQLGLRSIFFISMCLLVACGSEIKSVEPTINPNPKEIYDITVTVEGAPGEFLSAEGDHGYAIENEDCLPPASAFSMSGGRPVVAYRGEKVYYRRTSPTTFTTRVILDKFIPKDDYGLGKCRWNSSLLSAKLSNGINLHSIFMSPKFESGVRRGYQTIAFRLDKSVGESDMVSLSGGKIDAANKEEYTASGDYFFISMKSKKAD